jgi:signal peptidase II
MVKPRFFPITLLVLMLDQLTKYLANWLVTPIAIIPGFLSLTTLHNYGAGFGILQGQIWLLTWVSVIVIGFILYSYEEILRKRMIVGASLVLAGVLGNLIDRVFFGYVVDFISFSFWPAFNVADSAITIGVIILVIQSQK